MRTYGLYAEHSALLYVLEWMLQKFIAHDENDIAC